MSKPLAYGYMRVPDGMEDEEIHAIENGLYQYADTHGFELPDIHYERSSGATDVEGLLSFLARKRAEHVIVPSLEQIVSHPAIQVMVASAILHAAGARLYETAGEPRAGRGAAGRVNAETRRGRVRPEGETA